MKDFYPGHDRERKRRISERTKAAQAKGNEELTQGQGGLTTS